jgi:guanosine-3',5'-bis(diphosphate) 3'-pyrophosphohydrolase
MKLLEAKKFAIKKHMGLKRDNSKTPYWKHLEKVVKNLEKLGIKDESILCAGWLHDTIEDTSTDYDDIYEKFGKKTADIVVTVTKDTRMIKKSREIAYCNQLKKGTWQAQIVKFGDILANMEDLKSYSKPMPDRKKQAKNKLLYYNVIKTGLNKNKKQIPNLNAEIERLSNVFLKYGIKI